MGFWAGSGLDVASGCVGVHLDICCALGVKITTRIRVALVGRRNVGLLGRVLHNETRATEDCQGISPRNLLLDPSHF